jgi:hypothetical protein
MAKSDNGFIGAQHAAPGAHAWRCSVHPSLPSTRNYLTNRIPPNLLKTNDCALLYPKLKRAPSRDIEVLNKGLFL